MHPAPSIILFTILSGIGFGAMIWLGLAFLLHGVFMLFISILAPGCAAAGLLASTFHLGRPERAWRAVSQWRSSWLSREAVFALFSFCAFALFFVAALMTSNAAAATVCAALAVFGSLATLFATAMIYAQLRTVPRWNSFLTPCCFLAFALSSGGCLFLLASEQDQYRSEPTTAFTVIIAIAIAGLFKIMWWRRADRCTLGDAGSTPRTASGLSGGHVRLFDAPPGAQNYLMKEMVFQIGRNHALKLRRICYLMCLLLPILFLVISALSGGMLLFVSFIILALHCAGLLIERWLFFAEAEHTVSLYFQHN